MTTATRIALVGVVAAASLSEPLVLTVPAHGLSCVSPDDQRTEALSQPGSVVVVGELRDRRVVPFDDAERAPYPGDWDVEKRPLVEWTLAVERSVKGVVPAQMNVYETTDTEALRLWGYASLEPGRYLVTTNEYRDVGGLCTDEVGGAQVDEIADEFERELRKNGLTPGHVKGAPAATSRPALPTGAATGVAGANLERTARTGARPQESMQPIVALGGALGVGGVLVVVANAARRRRQARAERAWGTD